MIQRPRGTDDILPSEAPRWRRFERLARELFERNGYREIRTPHFEFTELFHRGIGEGTDIVTKEMFTFTRGAEGEEPQSYTLRPELTAPIVRAYLEHSLHKSAPFQKLYAIGPNFRAERPAAGRRRQFWQVDVEVLGATSPHADAETVILMDRLFKALGLTQHLFYINAIGLPEERKAYVALLREFLVPHRERLCKDCQVRYERNPLRILDCKVPSCRAIVETAPTLESSLGETSRQHAATVRQLLDAAGVKTKASPWLVRGFDYYTHFVYECVHLGLDAAQNAVGGGGRYDGLVGQLGGPATGAVGFGVGIERTLLAIEAEKKMAEFEAAEALRLDAYVVCLDAALRDRTFTIVNALRDAGLAADMDYEGRSMKAQMRSANKLAARYAVVVGTEEAASGQWAVKNLESGTQEAMALERIAAHIRTEGGAAV